MIQSDSFKKEGNSFFAKGDYISALVKYTEAICSKRNDPILYSNRAATFLKLESWNNAISDCELGLELINNDSNNAIKLKLLWRKSIGLRKLKNLNEASKVIQIALNHNPQSEYLRNEYNLILQELKALKSETEVKVLSTETRATDLIDIKIAEVDKIPEDFYREERNISEDSQSITNGNDERKSTDISGDLRSKDSSDFPINPSLQFILSLQDRPSNETMSWCEYLLKLPKEAYLNIFSVTGIDPEVLTMFLKACIALLEGHKLEYKSEMIEKLNLFKKLPRFTLTSLFVDSKIIEEVSKQFENKIGENFMSYWK